jgi:hypothetical protein
MVLCSSLVNDFRGKPDVSAEEAYDEYDLKEAIRYCEERMHYTETDDLGLNLNLERLLSWCQNKLVERVKNKTIADVAVVVLKRTDNPGVMWGDTMLLDEIAATCVQTTLMQRKDGTATHPLARHKRILDALERDKRFEKWYIRFNGLVGRSLVRSFRLRKDPPDSTA